MSYKKQNQIHTRIIIPSVVWEILSWILQKPQFSSTVTEP